MEQPSPISAAEYEHWKKLCLGLFEQIVTARMAGRKVSVDQYPDLMQANIGAANGKIFVPSGLTHTHILI